MDSKTTILATKASLTKTCFLFAGEQSGDKQGAEILKALKKNNPELVCFGVGGKYMLAEGLYSIAPMEAFSLMGIADILSSLPNLYLLFHQIKKTILQLEPEVCLFIDSPDFSLRMQKSLRKSNFKGRLTHYVCPSIWAWKKSRKSALTSYLDHLFTLFPFEKSLFDNTPLATTFVGHPLAQKELKKDSSLFRQERAIPPNAALLSIFPGSRKGEISRNLPYQLQLAKKFKKKHPDFLFLLSICRKDITDLYKQEISKAGLEEGKDIWLCSEEFNDQVMQQSLLAIATSGTITLELALRRIPTMITYKVRFLDYILFRYLFRLNLPYYCIVNILYKREIFPELVGHSLSLKEGEKQLETLFLNKEAIKKTLSSLQDELTAEKPASLLVSEVLQEYL